MSATPTLTASPTSNKGKERLARLRRRRDYLEAQLAIETHRDRSYDRSEARALTWAIDFIESHTEEQS